MNARSEAALRRARSTAGCGCVRGLHVEFCLPCRGRMPVALFQQLAEAGRRLDECQI